MLPVTILPAETLVNTNFAWKYRRRSRQPAPFNIPAPYAYGEAGVMEWVGAQPNFAPCKAYCQGYNYVSRSYDPIATNRAYEKFVGSIHETATLQLLLAERREAAAMMLNRVLTLRKAWLALRTGRFKDFLKALDVPPKRKHRGTVRVRAKQASAYWLEYWFGWSPFVSDIFTAVELLDSPYPMVKVSKVSGSTRTILEGLNHKVEEMTRCKITADVSISNPMLYRASQFGIVNPALVAWELVPFSFLVDWFIPVGNYLRSYTDFVGLELRDPCHSYQVRGVSHYGYRLNRGGPVTTKANFTAFNRFTGMPGPSITVTLPNRLSVTRGATAISLLVSLFVKDTR